MAGLGGNEPKPKQCLGFLTVVDCPQDGLFGGYLALNFLGRPLEFRCTAPIKANRAQQILYGQTLDAYLYGEQIGKTLLEGVSHPPLVICTDRRVVLAVGDFVDMPVTLVESPASQQVVAESASMDSEAKTWRLHAAGVGEPPLNHFQLGRNRLATPAGAQDDPLTITDCLAELADSFDLAEPFVRIREAIEEARHAGGC